MEIRFKVHYSFYIFLFFIIYFNGFSLFFTYFISLFIHEISHYLLSRRYNKMSNTINIYPYGMDLSVNTHNLKSQQNFLIFLIGPLINILMLLIIISSWWYFPVLYFYTKDFALANFCLGFFNLLPLYPLDGGNMILTMFNNYNIKCKILKIMKIFAIVFGVFFMILFIISCFSTLNFSCFCISFFMFSTVFSHKEILNSKIKNKLNIDDCVKELKVYVIKYDSKYEDVKMCFDDEYYVQFYIVDNDNKILKILNQDQIKRMYIDNYK